MDWKTFTVEIIKSISWPITVILTIFILKKPLIDLIPFLRKLKYKDFELEFNKELNEVQDKVNSEFPVDSSKQSSIEEIAERFKQLADISPQACILDAWKELEISSSNALKKRYPEKFEDMRYSPMHIGNALIKSEIFDKNKLEIFNRLRILRNKAAYHDDFILKGSEAIEYAISALKLISYLNDI